MLANIPGYLRSAQLWPLKKSFTIFFSGCNYNCQYCDSYSIIKHNPEHERPLKDLKLEIKKNKLHVDSVLITGGEPTINRLALKDLAVFTKSLDLQFGIETNGSKPGVIKDLLGNNLLDFMALDIKSLLNESSFDQTTKASTFFISPEQLLGDLKQTLLHVKNHNLLLEIRTTIIPTLLFKKEDLLEIAKTINELNAIWVLQPYTPAHVDHKKFQGIQNPTITFTETLRDFILTTYPNLQIEIRERKTTHLDQLEGREKPID